MSRPTSQAELEKLQKQISKHHDILAALRGEAARIGGAVLDFHMNQSRSFLTSKTGASYADNGSESIEETKKQIIGHKNTAAAVYCKLALVQAHEMPFTKDVIGIFAMLATVENDNLSEMLAEYLGPETMMGIVCRTNAGMSKLTKGSEGASSFLEYAALNKEKITARFNVFCLEDLTPYAGGVLPNDPGKKLNLPAPKRADGSCPDGFLGFAVNMVRIEGSKLSFVTRSGHGLRETLFYNVFKNAHVYKTRRDMINARSVITNGALSLDGGIVKESGVYILGNRKDVGVKFPVYSPIPHSQNEVTNKALKLQWEEKNISDDIAREEQLLDYLNKIIQ